MPADQIEPKASDWDLIKSAPGICVVGKTSDGNFYEVAVRMSYIPWLASHKFQFQLGHHHDRVNPAAPGYDFWAAVSVIILYARYDQISDFFLSWIRS